MQSKKNRIIIVDDDEDLLKILMSAFGAKGYEVKTFVNGKDGLNYLSEEKNMAHVALVILDRMLPDMDGLEILKSIKTQSAPVLILSVLSSEKDVLIGLRKGAVDYLGKPFSLPILMQKASVLIKE